MSHDSLYTIPRKFRAPYSDADGTGTLFASTATSFTARIATVTKPVLSTTAFVFPNDGNLGFMQFYGAGADNTTFDVKVIGWTECLFGGSVASMWFPKTQWHGACTLSALTGVSGHAKFTDTYRLADTIVEEATTTTDIVGTTTVISPAADVDPGIVVFDKFGASLIEVQFDMTGATSGGVLIAGF